MEHFIVDMQTEKSKKYYFIREEVSQEIVLLPSKLVMHWMNWQKKITSIWSISVSKGGRNMDLITDEFILARTGETLETSVVTC